MTGKYLTYLLFSTALAYAGGVGSAFAATLTPVAPPSSDEAISQIVVTPDASTVLLSTYHTDTWAYGVYLWSSAGGMTAITNTIGGTSLYGDALSANGQVVAGTLDDENGAYHMFRWTKSGGITLLPNTIGGVGGSVNKVSADGSVVAGSMNDANGVGEVFRWTQATGTVSLGVVAPNNSYTTVTAMTPSGGALTGTSNFDNQVTKSFHWAEASGLTDLGHFGGNSTRSAAITPDGNVVVGHSFTGGMDSYAFRWTLADGLVNIGTIQNGHGSYAEGVSDNGAIIFGTALDQDYNSVAMRWTQQTGMQKLGSLGGSSSNVLQMTGDGAVIIGRAENASGFDEAYRWSESSGMVGLGTLNGNVSEVKNMNANGSVIIGRAFSDSTDYSEAFRWTQATGTKSVLGLVADAGVNVNNWQLTDANGVSADGNIVIGKGTHNGVETAYVANLAKGGLTTPTDLGNSLQTVQQTAQQVAAVTRSYAPSGLFLAQNMPQLSVSMSAPAPTSSVSSGVGGSVGGGGMSSSSDANSFANLSTNSGGPAPSRIGAFLLGSVGIGHNNTSGNNQLNGTIGINAQMSDSWNLGLGMIAGKTHSELAFDGNSRLNSLGGMALASYTPYESPLRIFAAAFASDLSLDNKRGYLNGSGLDFSQGKTGGFAYGAALRFGWEKMLPDARTTVMPYVEGRYSKTKLDGYSENGGAFDATFSEQEDTYTASRLGVEFKHQINDKLQVMFRPAWGHRFGGNGDGFTATTGGLAVGYAGQAGDRDWAEGTIGASYRATDKLTFTTELSARTGNTSEPQASITVGAFMRF